MVVPWASSIWVSCILQSPQDQVSLANTGIGPIMGPLIGPMIGGGLTAGLGWRSTQWFQTIYGALLLLCMILLLPETHQGTQTAISVSNISNDSEYQAPGKSHGWVATVGTILLAPLKILALLRYPIIALAVYYASMGYGALMFLNISIQDTFSHEPYKFSPTIVGLLYMFNSIGYLLASLIGGAWIDRIMHRNAKRADRYDQKTGTLVLQPEDRLGENIWISAIVLPASLIWYGWCAQFRNHWVATMLPCFFFGISSMLLFNTVMTMLTEFIPRQSSSGVALNNFLRNFFAFIGALTAEPGIVEIGNGWLFTIIAIISLISALCMVAVKRWAEPWRRQVRT